MNPSAATNQEEKIALKRAKWRADYHANKVRRAERTRELRKIRYSRDSSKEKEQNKKWREAHPYCSLPEEKKKKQRASCTRSYYKHHDKLKAYHRKKRIRAYSENPEKIRESNRRWAKRNPQKIRARDARRRARKRLAEIKPNGIAEWMESVVSNHKASCYYCGSRLYPNPIHFDHIIPLIKGGPHTIENLCASCPTCNLKKGVKLATDWIKSGQMIFPI